jgi:hypothetical protein
MNALADLLKTKYPRLLFDVNGAVLTVDQTSLRLHLSHAGLPEKPTEVSRPPLPHSFAKSLTPSDELSPLLVGSPRACAFV